MKRGRRECRGQKDEYDWTGKIKQPRKNSFTIPLFFVFVSSLLKKKNLEPIKHTGTSDHERSLENSGQQEMLHS